MFDNHLDLSEKTMSSAAWGSERSCFMETCIVHRDFRGNNLQFLTYFHIESLLWDDFDAIYTTVSPHNIFSLRNILQCGFNVCELKECYGGYMRFLLRKGLHNRIMIDTHSYKRAKITDFAKQQTLLAQNQVGYRMNHNSKGTWMLYSPASPIVDE